MQRRTSLCFAHDRPNRTCAGSRTANLPPTISITAPANNAAFTAPATVHVSVNAADSDGTVTQVQYYDGVPPGAHLLGTLTTAPFSTDLLAQVAGDYTVVAVATDNSGAQASSSILSFTVNGSAGAAQVFYIHTDQLDTPRLITNSNNSAVWRWDNFDAFGDNPPNDDPSATGLHFIYNPRFAGQYFDKETRLNYNYFRDYDTGTGRYVESDPIGLAGGSYSTYTYVKDSPLRFTDPSGLTPQGTANGAAIGASVVAAASVVVDAATGGANIAATPSEIAAGAALGGAIGNAISNAMSGSESSSSSSSDSSSSSASDSKKDCGPEDKCKQRKNYCINYCQFELDFPGRTGHDNTAAFRKCVRRCMELAGCSY